MKDTTTSHLVADQIVDMLAEGGIRHIYAITGDSLNALTDAIGRDGRIRFIHMRHEESGHSPHLPKRTDRFSRMAAPEAADPDTYI